MRRLAFVVTLTSVVLATVVAPASAAPGDFDPTFDGDGLSYPDVGGGAATGEAVAIAPNGKIVVAGHAIGALADFAVTRLLADGTPDPAFGTNGAVLTDFSGGSDNAYDVAFNSVGKIVAAGESRISDYKFAVARYRKGGNLDTSFSANGKVKTAIPGYTVARAQAVAVQDDDKIVVGGSADSGAAGTGTDFVLARYNRNGSLDTSFDGDGIVTTDFFGSGDSVYDVAIQGDGSIVAVGDASDAGDLKVAVARYDSSGALDATFSTDGKATAGLTGAGADAFAVALQTDGKIVVCGPGGGDFVLMRFETDGTLDATFAGDGKKTVDFGLTEICHAVGVQSDGRIVGVGFTYVNADYDFAVVRLESDGRFDTGYGAGGLLTVDLGGSDLFLGAAVQDDDKLVATGPSPTSTAFTVARFLAA